MTPSSRESHKAAWWRNTDTRQGLWAVYALSRVHRHMYGGKGKCFLHCSQRDGFAHCTAILLIPPFKCIMLAWKKKMKQCLNVAFFSVNRDSREKGLCCCQIAQSLHKKGLVRLRNLSRRPQTANMHCERTRWAGVLWAMTHASVLLRWLKFIASPLHFFFFLIYSVI